MQRKWQRIPAVAGRGVNRTRTLSRVQSSSLGDGKGTWARADGAQGQGIRKGALEVVEIAGLKCTPPSLHGITVPSGQRAGVGLFGDGSGSVTSSYLVFQVAQRQRDAMRRIARKITKQPSLAVLEIYKCAE